MIGIVRFPCTRASCFPFISKGDIQIKFFNFILLKIMNIINEITIITVRSYLERFHGGEGGNKEHHLLSNDCLYKGLKVSGSRC